MDGCIVYVRLLFYFILFARVRFGLSARSFFLPISPMCVCLCVVCWAEFRQWPYPITWARLPTKSFILFIVIAFCVCESYTHLLQHTDQRTCESRCNKYATQKRARSPFAVCVSLASNWLQVSPLYSVRQLNTLLYFLSTVSILLSAPMMRPHSKTRLPFPGIFITWICALCECIVRCALHTARCT